MNPIFSRRYKGGSRPNIMPTSRRQNFGKSLSNAGSGSPASSPLSESVGALSLGDSVDDGTQSPCEEAIKPPVPDQTPAIPISSRKSRGHHKKEKVLSPADDAASRKASHLLAQQLLASKQNMLAHMSLTPQENRQRAKFGTKPTSEQSVPNSLRHSSSTEGFSQYAGPARNEKLPKSPTVHDIGGDMTLCDMEDDVDYGMAQKGSTVNSTPGKSFTSPAPSAPSLPRISRPNLNQRISKEPLDMKTWRELKSVVIGNTSFHDGWQGQGFIFDLKIPFGLVQKKGGPCGVLAVVQSLLIRNMLFGSPFNDLNEKGDGYKEDFQQFLLEFENENWAESIRRNRVQCLIDAVAEILWTCAQQRHRDEGIASSTKDCTSIIMLSDSRIQAETIHVSGRLELQHFLENSMHRFDCIALVYSAVLSRGISGVKDDMDFENCSLVGQHGYCSQELINLLCLGRAISNTFNDEIELDGKVLKGISKQCDIGLLSLFEHYDSIKVGSYLKCPRFPVWIVCSESHFSVLFSFERKLCNENDGCEGNLVVPGFDLFYYDGLARQDKVIRLSIGSSESKSLSSGSSRFSRETDGYGRQHEKRNESSKEMAGDSDLVPPLEKCIRTKWSKALVDWNDTEPIL